MDQMTGPPGEVKARRDRIIIVVSILLSLLLVASCFVVPYLLSPGGSGRKEKKASAPAAASGEELKDLEAILSASDAYMEARRIVEQNYVDAVGGDELLAASARGIRRLAREGADEEALVERGIEALIDSLDDPHSSYMDAEELARLDSQLAGHFSGIGVALEQVKDEIRVARVLDGTPAMEAGMKEGDIIQEVDGEGVQGRDINEVVSIIRGPEGTAVKVGITRPPSSSLTVYDIMRRDIEMKVVITEMKEGGVGYMRVTDWTSDVDAKIAGGLAELREQGARSLVVDLRLNPGGYMEPAIRAADLFLRGGVIVTSRGRVAGTDKEYEAEEGVEWDLPVVILIDRGTASSSEIFSAALRDNDRCILVGETSFGKGSIQKIYRQSDGTGLRLTLARYFTPSGASIDDEGIDPDIMVKNPVVGDEDAQLQRALEEAAKGVS